MTKIKINYYSIFTDQSGLNGVPIFLDARLWEKIPEDPMAPVTKEYNKPWLERTPWYKKVEFPEKLYLIVKAPKVDFDFYWYVSGFIVSKKFIDIISKFNSSFESVKLEVLSNKLKQISTKEYYFVRFFEYENVIDYQNSIYTAKEKDGEPAMIFDSIWVEKFEKIKLIENRISKDLFCLSNSFLISKLFCSSNFKEHAEKESIYGIRFVPTDDLADYINNHKFLK